MLKLKVYTWATGCKEPTHWKRPWCWERLKAKGEEGNKGCQIASLTQWTWIWANCRRRWRTGKPGVLPSMGSQSQTQLSNWTTITAISTFIIIITMAVCSLKEIQANFGRLGGWKIVSYYRFNFNFMYLPAIWIPCFVKWLFKSFACLSLGLSVFSCWLLGVPYTFGGVLCRICPTNIFSVTWVFMLNDDFFLWNRSL